jgi:hypothetical protein
MYLFGGLCTEPQLEQLAKEKDETVSDYVRGLLTKHVLQEDDYVSGMSPELLHAISAEAKRRRISTPDLIARLTSAAFARLRKNTATTVFILD